MSTRCQVTIIQEGLSWEQRVTLYKHTDGYPANVIPALKEAYELAIEPVVYGNRSYEKKWRAGRAGQVASYICATQPGSFEPGEGHQLRGNIEYYYRLYLVNKKGNAATGDPIWEIEIYVPSEDFSDQPVIENMIKLLERSSLLDVNRQMEYQLNEPEIENVEVIGKVDVDDLIRLFDEIDLVTARKG